MLTLRFKVQTHPVFANKNLSKANGKMFTLKAGGLST